MKILIIAGARPNFMKIAPIIRAIEKYPNDIQYELVHTGQHFDKNMSDAFFEDLWLPYPDVNLNINWGSVSEQIGKVMIAFDVVIKEKKPDFLLVVWDVNATIACAVVAKQNGVKVVHVESGLRSFDMWMPEEINRIITDRISDYLFVTEESWLKNLSHEWIHEGVFLVWNVMIDSLANNLDTIKVRKTHESLGREIDKFGLVTMHRPSNTDNRETLERLLIYIQKVSLTIPLIFPLHPRTKANIEKFGFFHYLELSRITTTPPLGYIDFINLLMHSRFILTDSGWVQEEATFLQIPCLTMRENTERPVTCTIGSNTLVGNDFDMADKLIDDIMKWEYKKWAIPDLWDGKAAERIVDILLQQV